MKRRAIGPGLEWLGAVDWNRRLFDSLIPLPDGTSYNAYLVQGREKTALLDTVDPSMTEVLLRQLEDVPRIDYLISHHAEQDHSGAIPTILRKYPEAQLLCTPKAKPLLIDHLDLPAERIMPVEDGQTLDLGGKTLQFLHTPWVHWPETMCTYLPEDQILFSCDFFGSHLASSELFAGQDAYVLQAAKRYYAEIMMPFRKIVAKNIDKIRPLQLKYIAPSHGPIYDRPQEIIAAYAEWVSDRVANLALVVYVSMHGSTEMMVNYLVAALAQRDVRVQKYELTTTDLGKLAMDLVDAATLVLGTPTVHGGPHPTLFAATHLVNALRPKLRYAAIVGSYGWGGKAPEQITQLIPNVQVELLGSVLCKGLPRKESFSALEALAEQIAQKHKAL